MRSVLELIEAIEEGALRYAAFAEVEAGVLRLRYAPGKWTGLQILAHVADSDMANYIRMVQALSVTGDELSNMPYAAEVIMDVLRCAERPAEISLAAIRGARGLILHTLRALPEESLRRELNHPQLGKVSALWYAGIVADHGLHHVEQVEAIRDRSPGS